MVAPPKIEVRRTTLFVDWLAKLRDVEGAVRITKRLDRLAKGNLGDHRGVGDGVSELRLAFGPGYRIYFTRRGEAVMILLCGGDKSSQSRDIARAKELAKEIE